MIAERHWTRAFAVALLILGTARAAQAGPATDWLKPQVNRVVAVLTDPMFKPEARAAQRRDAIRAITEGVFDWTEMARQSLGRHWEARTEEERRDFVALFRSLIERAYVGKVEQYSGEEIIFAGEFVDGDHATVRTRLVTKGNREVSLDYRLVRRGHGWAVSDVIVENISLVANYRTQFDGIIRTSSYEELVRRIKGRTS